MDIGIQKIKNAIVVRLAGDMDQQSCRALEQCLIDEIVEKGERHIIMDMGRMLFLKSQGLHLIVVIAKILHLLEGKISVVNANDAVLEVLDLAGITCIIPVVGMPQQSYAA